MIDTIYLALTGLRGFERGLRVIANNTANLNTPGFKGSGLLFADMYSPGGPGAGGNGLGLSTLGTVLSFQQGQMQNTNNGLDLAVDGSGMFMLRDRAGIIRYTRDGQFKFNSEGVLVSSVTGDEVMAYGANGALGPVNISALRMQPAHATDRITFARTLSTGMDTVTLDHVTVFDTAGGSHSLTVTFTRVLGQPQTAWNVEVHEGETAFQVQNGQIVIGTNGEPEVGHDIVTFTLTGDGIAATEIALDFSENVNSNDMGGISSLTVASQNGYAPGTLTATSFDANGRLVITYSNGQTVGTSAEDDDEDAVRLPRLALARFNSPDAVRATGDNRFEAIDEGAWVRGMAGEGGFGSVRSGVVEMSNVDLSSEFSELVVMQRGYQASSQVASTANEMLSELFGMKGK